MDAGYDVNEIYQEAYTKYNAQVIAPLNWRNTKIPPIGVNMKGQITCSLNFPYAYGGYDTKQKSIRLLCPRACAKVDCPMGSSWYTNAESGYVAKVKIETNPRFVSSPMRETEAWQELYNERTSVERFFGEGKENYDLNNLRVAGLDKVKVFVDLTRICLLAKRMSKVTSLSVKKSA